jgi:hypothetical protein
MKSLMKDGEPFVVEGDEEEESDDAFAYTEFDVAAKFIRVFTQEEEKYFCIFFGTWRGRSNCATDDYDENSEVELSYRVPAPEDGLIAAAGLLEFSISLAD